MRRKDIALLVLGLSGCGLNYDPASEIAQRDIYSKMEDCVADWGDKELCAKSVSSEGLQQTSASVGSSSHTVYLGPEYYGDRQVNRNGVQYRPTAMRSIGKQSVANPAAVRRGGFGSIGRALGFHGG